MFTGGHGSIMKIQQLPLAGYLDSLPNEFYIVVSRDLLQTREALLPSVECWCNQACRRANISFSMQDLYALQISLSQNEAEPIALSSGTWRSTAMATHFVLKCEQILQTDLLLAKYPIADKESFLAVDWSKTRLGPVHSWPVARRNAVLMCFSMPFPASVWFLPEGGSCEDLVMIHNKGYTSILGKKTKWAQGRSFMEIWAEVAGPVMEVMNVALGGETVLTQDTTFLVDTSDDVPLQESGCFISAYQTRMAFSLSSDP